MILRLAREQIRSQWRFTVWMGALVAIAVGFAMYAMATTATMIAFEDGNPTVNGWGLEGFAFFDSDPDRPDAPPPGPGNGLITDLSLNDLDALLDEASGVGPVVAQRSWGAEGAGTQFGYSVVAPLDSEDWAPYVLTGEIAGPGQVLVRWDVAEKLHLDLGDAVALSTEYPSPSAPHEIILRVSGTMKGGDATEPFEPYWSGSPHFVAHWSDSAAIDYTLRWRYPSGEEGSSRRLQTIVAWEGDNGVLASYQASDVFFPDGFVDLFPDGQHGFTFGSASGRLDAAGAWSLLIAGLLTLCVIVAAVAMGRAQAGARARWTATARVMGARRGTLVGASLVEALGVGVVSGALGSALGAGAVAASLAGLRRARPNSILPLSPSVPAVLYGAAILVAVILAILIAAMPAFWATRVEPVAALKPVTPLTDRNLSRDVSPWWPTWLTGAAASVLVGGYLADARMAPGDHVALAIALGGAWLMGALGLAALAVQGARAIVAWSGRALLRAKRPWAIVAGEGLVAHRKVFTFTALSSLVFAVIVAAAATSSAQVGWDWDRYDGDSEPAMLGLPEWWHSTGGWSGHVGLVGPLFVIVTGVAIAVTLSARQTVGLDAATQAALGLRRGHAQFAAGARQFAPAAVGLVAGTIVGVAGWMLAHDVAGSISRDAFVYSWNWHVVALGHALVGALAALTALLAVALAGALVVGLATRPGTPVEVLRRNVR